MEDQAMSPFRLKPSLDGFGLDDPNQNRSAYMKYANKEGGVLASGTNSRGFKWDITLFGDIGSKGKILGRDEEYRNLFYYVSYERMHKKIIGISVTQTLLWRASGHPQAQNVTSTVVFEHLLKLWPIILSDKEQTPDGEKFWRDLIARADTKGHKYGLVDFSGPKIDEPYLNESVQDFWIRVNEQAYGTERKHEARRFWIKAK